MATRAREVHDFWHVLFACHTNVLGELALKAVEYVQTGLPMAALSVAGAQYRLKERSRGVLRRELLPWAYRAGTSCEDLMCLYYERHLEVRGDVDTRWWCAKTAQTAHTKMQTSKTCTNNNRRTWRSCECGGGSFRRLRCSSALLPSSSRPNLVAASCCAGGRRPLR